METTKWGKLNKKQKTQLLNMYCKIYKETIRISVIRDFVNEIHVGVIKNYRLTSIATNLSKF